ETSVATTGSASRALHHRPNPNTPPPRTTPDPATRASPMAHQRTSDRAGGRSGVGATTFETRLGVIVVPTRWEAAGSAAARRPTPASERATAITSRPHSGPLMGNGDQTSP